MVGRWGGGAAGALRCGGGCWAACAPCCFCGGVGGTLTVVCGAIHAAAHWHATLQLLREPRLTAPLVHLSNRARTPIHKLDPAASHARPQPLDGCGALPSRPLERSNLSTSDDSLHLESTCCTEFQPHSLLHLLDSLSTCCLSVRLLVAPPRPSNVGCLGCLGCSTRPPWQRACTQTQPSHTLASEFIPPCLAHPGCCISCIRTCGACPGVCRHPLPIHYPPQSSLPAGEG